MENIKNLRDLSINIPKNFEKVENVILENEYIDNNNNNDDEENRLNLERLLEYKKINDEARDNAKWTFDEVVVENLVNQFVTYSDDNNIDWKRFDYSGDFDYDYYKKRFPQFDDEVINILVKCSKKKVEDNRIKHLEKKEGNFVVDFN